MRAAFWLLVGLLVGGSVTAAHAGYAVPAVPPSWGGVPGAWTSTAAANAESFFAGGFRGAGAVLNVGGRSVVMPAAYRFAANAPQFAARALFLNPALATGVAVAAWIAGECLGVQDGSWVVTCGPGLGTQSVGYEYRFYAQGQWMPDAQAACDDWGSYWVEHHLYADTLVSAKISGPAVNVSCALHGKTASSGSNWTGQAYGTRASSCPAGWYVTDQGCVQTPQPIPATQDDFDTKVSPKPMPLTLPQEIPGPWPVLPPVINPTPGDDPQPQPLRIPTGNPVPIPGTDPQEYRQPVTRVVPSPSPDSPWRVDVQPEDVQGTDPVGLIDPETVPAAEPVTPAADPPDLCARHPDIVACQTLDQVGDVDLNERQLPVAIAPDAGWGPSDASCPAPRTLTAQGRSIEWSWDLYCDFAQGVRPLFLAFAWLSAAGMLVAALRGA